MPVPDEDNAFVQLLRLNLKMSSYASAKCTRWVALLHSALNRAQAVWDLPSRKWQILDLVGWKLRSTALGLSAWKIISDLLSCSVRWKLSDITGFL